MWDLLVAAQDALTALCAAFNALYFVRYGRRPAARPRRVGACALVLVNGSVAVQAVFFLALYLTHRWSGPVEGFFSPGVWMPARAPMLAATAFVSLLIVRQQRRGV